MNPQVSKLPRIVNVSELNMEIADQEGESTRLKVKGEATTFRFIEHEAAPAPAAAPANAKKPVPAPAAQGGKNS